MNEWSNILIIGFIMFGAMFGYMAALMFRIKQVIELKDELVRLKKDNAQLMKTNETLVRAMPPLIHGFTYCIPCRAYVREGEVDNEMHSSSADIPYKHHVGRTLEAMNAKSRPGPVKKKRSTGKSTPPPHQ